MNVSVDRPVAPARLRRRLVTVVSLATLGAVLVYCFVTSSFASRAESEGNGDAASGRATSAAPSRPAAHHVAAAATLDSDAWPNLFGPTHDSVATWSKSSIPAWDEAGPSEAWRVPCGLGYSSPIVWHDRLILLERVGDEEIVSCRKTTDGSPIWEQRYPTTFVCGSTYTNGPYSTPATDGELVFTLGAQSQLHCWKLSDGSPVWSRMLKEEFAVPDDLFGSGHSPLLWGERLIVNVGGTKEESGIIAFDKQTGDIRWQSTNHGAAFATPKPARILDRDWLVVLSKDALSLLDPATGHERWSIDFEPQVPDAYNAVTPLVQGDVIMATAWGVGTQVFQIESDGAYAELWNSKRILTSQYAPLLAVDGCAVGVHQLDHTLRSVNLLTGEMQWRYRSELGASKHLVIGDRILLFGEYGHLGMIECRGDQLVEICLAQDSVFDGETRCFSAPAFVDGKLYLRNEAELVCLNLLAE